jgi:hypothetical protein
MARIERSIDINASWETVDAVALNATRTPEWFVGVESAQSDGVYPKVGGAMQLRYKAAGMTFDMTQKTLEYQPGSYILYKIDGAMIHGTQRWSHTPQGSGTRLTALFEYETEGGGLGAIADKLVLERMNTENLEKSLKNLKALAES